MASAWQTLEEAALTLGISSRTLARRLARGECETRLENGRREVLVVLSDSPAAPPAQPKTVEPPSLSDVADTAADATDNGYAAAFQAHLSEHQATNLSDSLHADLSDARADSDTDEVSDEVQSTMLALHEDRIRRTDLAIMAYQQSVNVTAADARRTHRKLRVAWSMAGGFAAALFVAVVWATHSVTKAQAEVENLNHAVRQLSDTADTRSREIERLRDKAQEAQIAAARVEGQLAAARIAPEPTAKVIPPATQPVTAAAPPVSATTRPASAMQTLMQRVTMQ